MKTGTIILFLFFCTQLLHAKTTAVIEAWDTHLYLPSDNNLTIREYMKVKILDEDGYSHAVFQSYYNAFRKIKNLKYTVYDSNNKKVKKFGRNDVVDMMINPSYQIDDARLLVLDPKYRNYPFTVEIEVEISYNGFLDFPVWMPRHSYDIEVKKASMTLECFKDFKFRSRELKGIPPPEVSVNGELKLIKWSTENLPAVPRHDSYKSFAADQGSVHIVPVNFTFAKTTGNFERWENFGEWFLELNEGRNTLSASTKKFLEDLKKTQGSNIPAITRDIYQYMQSKTRYISIQLGIGGYQTIPSDEVERTGYGDCKALTNYMKAMLDYLKIPCNYVLVSAGSDVPDILYDFPSNQFNHVFLAVPMLSDTLWYECTSQTLPPAHIGTFTDDRHVLWIDKGKSNIVHTPVYSAIQSTMRRHCTVKLQPQGDAMLDLLIIETGMFFDEAMAFQNLPKDYVEKHNNSKFTYKDFSIKSFDYKIPDANHAELNLNYKINVNGLGKSLGTKMILPYNLLTPIDKDMPLDIMNKKSEIRRAYTIEDYTDIIPSEFYRVNVMPQAIKEVTEFGTFEMNITTDEKDVIHVYRKTIINKGIYENESFDRFHEVIKKIRAVEQSKIVLQSKT